MREQLISYVDLLFAGAADAGDIKQEILQNTLDRYDDLLAQGKSPQAAYSLAISGIGDISELLQGSPIPAAYEKREEPAAQPTTAAPQKPNKKLMHAVAIALYICCPIPIIALSNLGSGTIGVVLMFLMIAAATVLMILSGDGKKEPDDDCGCKRAKNPARKAADKIITIMGLCLYFVISFKTGAWYITWLIFPIMAATEQLCNAIFDLVEGK